jgi:predicted component of type VI protein secretion system
MAAKNFQQTYGYEQEGKMIFTTTQDLNSTPASVEPNEDMQPYTVQFAITIDMKNGRYRCTISNVTFYMPTDYGNRRMTLYDVFQKETSGESRRIVRNARTLIESFERYLISLTNDLYTEVEHKAAIYNSKF